MSEQEAKISRGLLNESHLKMNDNGASSLTEQAKNYKHQIWQLKRSTDKSFVLKVSFESPV